MLTIQMISNSVSIHVAYWGRFLILIAILNRNFFIDVYFLSLADWDYKVFKGMTLLVVLILLLDFFGLKWFWVNSCLHRLDELDTFLVWISTLNPSKYDEYDEWYDYKDAY